MRIISLDIGSGTQDILLYDSDRNIENCIKMVLPTPSIVLAAKVREVASLSRDLFVEGDTIGGGAFVSALQRHIQKGLQVLMTEDAAYTVRNRIDEVTRLGIEVVTERPEDFRGMTLTIEEVGLKTLKAFLSPLGEQLKVDAVAVAVQDHGVSPKGTSNRQYRIQKMKDSLEKDPRLENLAFREKEVPPYFLRMRSAIRAARRQLPGPEVLVMDTSPAAIVGCLKDPEVERASSVLAVNVGNGHTIAGIFKNGSIMAMMEHHTSLLNSERLEQLLTGFAEGSLSDKEVFDEGGHGLFYLRDVPGLSRIEKIAATGPKRGILAQASLPVHFAAPAGDVMMTGNMGLIEVTKRKLGWS